MKTTLSRKNKINSGRRQAAGLILKTTALLPFVSLIKIPLAFAEELPHVTDDDPMAKALKYVHDAKTVERPEKGGIPGDQQTCVNCQFLTGDEGEWRPCQLFPGKSVHIDGWCINWTHKT